MIAVAYVHTVYSPYTYVPYSDRESQTKLSNAGVRTGDGRTDKTPLCHNSAFGKKTKSEMQVNPRALLFTVLDPRIRQIQKWQPSRIHPTSCSNLDHQPTINRQPTTKHFDNWDNRYNKEDSLLFYRLLFLILEHALQYRSSSDKLLNGSAHIM